MEIGYQYHILVCENEREDGHPRGCCAAKGSAGLRAVFKDLLKEHGLKARSRANKAGCFSYCELGPVAVVYPEGVWYRLRTREDVEAVVLSHIRDGKPVERLRIDREPDPRDPT